MGAAKTISEWFSCSRVLNLMVITGFMFNYMLRVNMTIAVVDMIENNKTNPNTTNLTTTNTNKVNITRFNWDETMKNDILGCFFWGYILTEIPGGRLAEVIGAKRVFGGGMLIASILTILTPAASYLSYYVLLVSRVLLGFFLGATWPSMPPMAAKWIPPLERSKFMANMMASSLGAALTMPVCGLLIANLGWASVFYITGVIGLLWSILWFSIIYDSPAEHPRISINERLEIEKQIDEGNSKKVARPNRVPWKQMGLSKAVWAVIITHACSVFCYFTIINQLPSYMKYVLHFNIKENGFLSSLPYVGKYAMAVISSYLADRLRKSKRLSTIATRKVFTCVALLLPCFFMILQCIWGIIPAVSVAIFTLSLFFNGAVTGGYLTNVLDIAPNFSGTIMGIANTASSIGGWISTKIVAVLTKNENTFHQWQYVFGILVGAYAVGAVCFLFMGSGVIQSWNYEEDKLDKNSDDKEMETNPLNKEMKNLA